MADPFLGEIRRIAFTFAPRGWALCNGQILPINQNQALFSLLGTTYGGDGTTTFRLPDLRGRSPIDPGDGFAQGQVGGAISHTLTLSELPAHTHTPRAASAAASTADPTGAVWATTPQAAYGAVGGATLDPTTIAPTGGGQAHENMPPYLVVNYIISMVGIYPSRN